MDHTLLGMRIIETLQSSVNAGLVRKGAIIMPHRAVVYAMLIDLSIGNVSGFDLRAMNAFRWHPNGEACDLACTPHRKLSQPFVICEVDMQGWLDSCEGDVEFSLSAFSRDVEIIERGMWNAVAVWFQLDLLPGSSCTTGSTPSSGSSWPQSIYYVHECPVDIGQKTLLYIRQTSTRFEFASTKQRVCRPMHSNIPNWHWDMLHDFNRNSAYERAIKRAVKKHKSMKAGEVFVLDLGSGSGLLSMMAARAGADRVAGVEQNRAMCEISDDILVANGRSTDCFVIQRDARRLLTGDSDILRGGRKPDGAFPELDRKADICVSEVLDAGCIGEGVLHISAIAVQRLLLPGATIIPAAARVFAVPISIFRRGEVAGVNVEQLNRFHWRSDYEGVDLSKESWTPAADKTEIFTFDFANVEAYCQPQQHSFTLQATCHTVVNAVAMWFTVQLDEVESLSSSPFGACGTTWPQAIQFVKEFAVQPGDAIQLVAAHDTYSIKLEASGGITTSVPVVDPEWLRDYARLDAANAVMMREISQSPLEFRRAALAATRLAALEPSLAFLLRFM